MLNFLYKYLILNDHVSIPGVGSFAIERSAATIHEDTIEPPRHIVAFSAGTALTEKKFYQYLSAETGLSEVDAVRKFQDFAYQLRKDIQSHPQVMLSRLGILKRNAQGAIVFEPTVSADRYFSPVTVTPVKQEADLAVRDEEAMAPHGIEVYDEDEPVRKDRWWIWALVLMIAALAVIGYFYMQGEII